VFHPGEVDFLQAVGNVLATAVERVESERVIMEVREDERRRLARDLHDEALQDLIDALAHATAARAGDAQALDRLAPILKRVGEHLRAAIHDLRLGGEEDEPFPELLENLVALHRAMAVDSEVQLEVREGVPSGSLGRPGTEVLRIVGEALVNARRHAGAGHVRVQAWASRDAMCIEVCDDGRGFDPAEPAADPAGTGLAGMRERAARLRADLEIESEPGRGTVVRLRLPLRPGPADEPGLVRVLLVEDHASVREAIAAAFQREDDFEVVGQASSLAEARELLEEVDVAVIDLGLPDGYGGELIEELREVNPGAQALVLSASLDRAEVARAVQSGAAGTLDKTAHLDEVVDVVRRVRAGETLLPMDEVVELLQFASRQRERERDDRAAIELLTPRERDVLQALAEGLDSQAIADRLHITLRTERNHIANVLAKLGVHSQLQALVLALRYGVVEVR
jgi:DNA-binding NarL/FixJ family response regulator/two-component sensor histidine kinase